MSDEGKAWLEKLESTVKQAAETVGTLRRERDDLTHQVQELEARVGELESAGGAGGDAGDAASAWKRERREIRKRVQKLTERLEALLDE